MALIQRTDPYLSGNVCCIDPINDVFHDPLFAASLTARPNYRCRTERIERSQIPVDLVEKDGCYHFFVDLPGVEKEDIDLSIDGHFLTINVKKSNCCNIAESDRYHVKERSGGAMERRMKLPDNIDPASADVEYKNGCVNISFLKTQSAAKRLTIN